MLILALLLAGQAGATPAATSWSILADPCAPSRNADGGDIVVCGQRDGTGRPPPRLSLPEESGPPDHPMPSNPDGTGAQALANSAPVCAARMAGCTVGVDVVGAGVTVIRLIGKLIDPDSCCDTPGEAQDPGRLVHDVASGVRHAFRKKPDTSNRVTIALDDPPVTTEGKLLP